MGTLFVVATPIGNSKDITLRALEVLREVDLILCEDTRHSGQFLSQYQISKPLLSLHEHNEVQKIPEILKLLQADKQIALISDAGTPLISDPGFKLVRELRAANINVVAIPGPNAAIAALSVSGLPTDKFLFVGYLPKTSGKREKLLKELVTIRTTLSISIIFYESPFRMKKLLTQLNQYFPKSQLSIQRELTKIHEEILTGSPKVVMEQLKTTKGEFTIILN